MNQYRKLIVAVLGLGALYAQNHFGYDLGPYVDQVADLLISAATAYAVWQAPNAPAQS